MDYTQQLHLPDRDFLPQNAPLSIRKLEMLGLDTRHYKSRESSKHAKGVKIEWNAKNLAFLSACLKAKLTRICHEIKNKGVNSNVSLNKTVVDAIRLSNKSSLGASKCFVTLMNHYIV